MLSLTGGQILNIGLNWCQIVKSELEVLYSLECTVFWSFAYDQAPVSKLILLFNIFNWLLISKNAIRANDSWYLLIMSGNDAFAVLINFEMQSIETSVECEVKALSVMMLYVFWHDLLPWTLRYVWYTSAFVGAVLDLFADWIPRRLRQQDVSLDHSCAVEVLLLPNLLQLRDSSDHWRKV